MTKLNTKAIKTFIITQLNSNPEFKNAPVNHHYPEDINEKMLNNWAKESNWVREMKVILKNDRTDCYSIIENYTDDSIDVAGEVIHPELINKNSIFRLFTSKEFVDSYRIEVLTDENDEKIIFWNLIVD